MPCMGTSMVAFGMILTFLGSHTCVVTLPAIPLLPRKKGINICEEAACQTVSSKTSSHLRLSLFFLNKQSIDVMNSSPTQKNTRKKQESILISPLSEAAQHTYQDHNEVPKTHFITRFFCLTC